MEGRQYRGRQAGGTNQPKSTFKVQRKGKKEEEVGGRGIDDLGQVLTCAVAEETAGMPVLITM